MELLIEPDKTLRFQNQMDQEAVLRDMQGLGIKMTILLENVAEDTGTASAVSALPLTVQPGFRLCWN
jgi:hypothetical protein